MALLGLASSAPELFLHILRELADPRDVLRLCAVSRETRVYASDHQTWTQLYEHWHKFAEATVLGLSVPPATADVGVRRAFFMDHWPGSHAPRTDASEGGFAAVYYARAVQIQSVVSVYNDEYQCRVNQVVLRHESSPNPQHGHHGNVVHIGVSFSVEGDNSLGALQEPQHSVLTSSITIGDPPRAAGPAEGQTFHYHIPSLPVEVDLLEVDPTRRYRGWLWYRLDLNKSETWLGVTLAFRYGISGYSTEDVLAFVADRPRTVDAPASSEPALAVARRNVASLSRADLSVLRVPGSTRLARVELPPPPPANPATGPRRRGHRPVVLGRVSVNRSRQAAVPVASRPPPYRYDDNGTNPPDA